MITDEEISNQFTEITELLQTYVSQGDWGAEPLSSLIVRASSIFYAWVNDKISELDSTLSIQDLIQDPSSVTSEIIDKLAANVGLTRQEGTKATGTVTVVLESLVTTVIPAGSGFTDDSGNTYLTTATFIGVVSQSLVTDSNTKLITQSGSNYTFEIEVEAEDASSQTSLKKLSALTPSSSLSNISQAYASADFSPGSDSESDPALLGRIQMAMSQPVNDSESHIKSLLVKQYPDISAVSVIGMGDPEMLRDKNNLLGVSTGGHTDVYIRNADLPQSTTYETTATLQDAAAALWEVNIPASVLPGFYSVTQIVLPNGTTVTDLTTNWYIDNLPDYIDMPATTDVRFSAYQGAVITFKDQATAIGKSDNDTQIVTCTLQGLANIGDINTWWNSAEVRNPASDSIIRAAVPCFITVDLTIEKTSAITVSTSAVQQAISNEINSTSFSLPFQVSRIIDVASGVIDSSCSVQMPVIVRYVCYTASDNMSGVTYENLDIEQDGIISPNTIVLYAYPQDINITVVSR